MLSLESIRKIHNTYYNVKNSSNDVIRLVEHIIGMSGYTMHSLEERCIGEAQQGNTEFSLFSFFHNPQQTEENSNNINIDYTCMYTDNITLLDKIEELGEDIICREIERFICGENSKMIKIYLSRGYTYVLTNTRLWFHSFRLQFINYENKKDKSVQVRNESQNSEVENSEIKTVIQCLQNGSRIVIDERVFEKNYFGGFHTYETEEANTPLIEIFNKMKPSTRFTYNQKEYIGPPFYVHKCGNTERKPIYDFINPVPLNSRDSFQIGSRANYKRSSESGMLVSLIENRIFNTNTIYQPNIIKLKRIGETDFTRLHPRIVSTWSNEELDLMYNLKNNFIHSTEIEYYVIWKFQDREYPRKYYIHLQTIFIEEMDVDAATSTEEAISRNLKHNTSIRITNQNNHRRLIHSTLQSWRSLLYFRSNNYSQLPRNSWTNNDIQLLLSMKPRSQIVWYGREYLKFGTDLENCRVFRIHNNLRTYRSSDFIIERALQPHVVFRMSNGSVIQGNNNRPYNDHIYTVYAALSYRAN